MTLQSLWLWLAGRSAPRQRPDLQFILYTRFDCPLCHDAQEILERQRARFGFRLQIVDVDQDPALVRDHGNCVPVVAVNGKVRFRGRINEVLLKRILDSDAIAADDPARGEK